MAARCLAAIRYAYKLANLPVPTDAQIVKDRKRHPPNLHRREGEKGASHRCQDELLPHGRGSEGLGIAPLLLIGSGGKMKPATCSVDQIGP